LQDYLHQTVTNADFFAELAFAVTNITVHSPCLFLNAIKLSRHSGMDRRTNRQDSRFARLRRPKGEGHGCPECIQSHGR